MSSMRIDTGTIEAEDSLDHVPRTGWELLLGARRMFVRTRIPHDCRQLLRFIEEATPEWLSHFGFVSTDDYVERGLKLDPQIAKWAVAGLKSIGTDRPVSEAAAVERGKLAAHGVNQHSKSGGVNHTSIRGTGNRDYTLARLNRDRPDLLAKVDAGHISARRAGIEAGFIKERTILDVLRAAWKKADRDTRAIFKSEID